jgi:thiamine-phosphate pyrophosphorylase
LTRQLPAQPFLYPIIDTGLCRNRHIDPVALCDAYLTGGARVLQLREKERSSGEFLKLADALIERVNQAGALLIINDRADVARLSGAAGVHVGQDDLAVADVRKLLPEPAIVGLSTHDDGQVEDAIKQQPTYVAVGPVFGTSTKDTGYSARGLDLVRAAAARGRPVVAIGGLTLDNMLDAVRAGASGIAVISDLLNDDPLARTRAFVARLAEAASPNPVEPR